MPNANPVIQPRPGRPPATPAPLRGLQALALAWALAAAAVAEVRALPTDGRPPRPEDVDAAPAGSPSGAGSPAGAPAAAAPWTPWRVLSANLYLKPALAGPHELPGRTTAQRADLFARELARASSAAPPDVIVASEAFTEHHTTDGNGTVILGSWAPDTRWYYELCRAASECPVKRKLWQAFGYRWITPNVDNARPGSNGGVFIASRWPIEAADDYVWDWGNTSAGDTLATKGVAYARVNRNGERLHVFGLHMQASYFDSFGREDNPAYRRDRRAQMDELNRFIAAQRIPAGELVVVAGDFNVARFVETVQGPNADPEFRELVNTLRGRAPLLRSRTAGNRPFSWDAGNNAVILDHRQRDRDGADRDPSALLDHVLVLRNGARYTARNTVVPLRANGLDLSDHHAVLGEIFPEFKLASPILEFHALLDPNRCIDVANGSITSGATVQTFACHGGRNQEWSFVPLNPSFPHIVEVQSRNSGLCLAATSPPQQQPCSGDARQVWQIGHAATDTAGFSLRNDASQRCLLPASGNRLELGRCQGRPLSAAIKRFEHPMVTLRPGPSLNIRCMDVPDGSSQSGVPITAGWYCHGGANQQWSFIPASNGRFKVRSASSGQCLTVSGSPLAANGAAVVQTPCGGNSYQDFLVNLALPNHVNIRASDGVCLGQLAGQGLANPPLIAAPCANSLLATKEWSIVADEWAQP